MKKIIFIITIFSMAYSYSEPASSGSPTSIWNGSAGGAWVTDANWTKGPDPVNFVPGVSATTFFNGDTARFTGTVNTTVTVDATRNLQWIEFNAGNPANPFTINGGTLYMTGTTNNGSIYTNGMNYTATIASSVVLDSSYIFQNNAALSTDLMRFTGGITSGVTGGSALFLDGANTGSNTISGVIGNGVGTLSITKNGAGTWMLSGANTYTGTTTLSNGILQIGVNSVGSVGSITSSAVGTGALALNGGTISSDSATTRTLLNAVTFGGDVALGNATNTGKLTFSAAANLGGATRTLTTASDAEFDGVISNGGLTKAGAGTLTLKGLNTYTGATTISAGTLVLDATAGANRINSGNALVLSGGTLQFKSMGTANGQTFGTTTLTGATNNALTLGTGYTSGVLVDMGTLSGTGALDVSNLAASSSWIKASGNSSSSLLLVVW